MRWWKRPATCRLQSTSGMPHYAGAEVLGHGIGYLYPHDFPHHWVEQQYLPDEIKGARFYEPSNEGFEGKLKERWPACGGMKEPAGLRKKNSMTDKSPKNILTLLNRVLLCVWNS